MQKGGKTIFTVVSPESAFNTNYAMGRFIRQKMIFSCKLSLKETVGIKCHMLFSRTSKKNISECSLQKFLPSMLSVNIKVRKGHLSHSMRDRISSRQHFKIFFIFFPENRFDISYKLSSCKLTCKLSSCKLSNRASGKNWEKMSSVCCLLN